MSISITHAAVDNKLYCIAFLLFLFLFPFTYFWSSASVTWFIRLMRPAFDSAQIWGTIRAHGAIAYVLWLQLPTTNNRLLPFS
jgi:hypothetical protein